MQSVDNSASAVATDPRISFPYTISFADCEPSPAVAFQIEEQLARLERFYERITDCRVVVRIPHKHSVSHCFHLHIQLDVPGKRLAVSREPDLRDDHAPVHAIIRDAFLKLTRQLEDYSKSRQVRSERA